MFKNYYRDNPRMPYGFEEHEQYVHVDHRTQILNQLPNRADWETNTTRVLTIDGFKRYVKFDVKPFGHWIATVIADDYYTKVDGHWRESKLPEEQLELAVAPNSNQLPF